MKKFSILTGETYTSNIPQAIRDVYSKEIIYAATPSLRFAQFAKRRDDLATEPGGTIKFTKFNSLQKGGKLTESVAIVPKSMGTSEVSISVDEYGNAIKVSEKSLKFSMHNVLQDGSVLLAKDMAQVLDEEIRDTALSTTNFVYAGGAASPGLMIGQPFSAQQVKDGVEALSGNNAPKIDGQYYVCIAHPHQLRQLRDDDDWVSVHQYVNVDEIFRGEVGMYEGVRFVETTQMPANPDYTSLAKYGIEVATWEATLFGENSFAWAVGQDVELRDNGIEDFGRLHGLAWYAIWGFGLIEENNIFTLLSC
jgi:N4-gp56 family major capsid protein